MFLAGRMAVTSLRDEFESADFQRDEEAGWAFQQRLLAASVAASAQTYALLAVPAHVETVRQPAEDPDRADPDKPADPIAEAGWLAAGDAMLMGVLLGEW